jgi:hypothetical protein
MLPVPWQPQVKTNTKMAPNYRNKKPQLDTKKNKKNKRKKERKKF